MSQNFVIVNNVSTTLAAAITSTTATSMTLSSTTNAPTLTAGQIWPVTLNDAATNSVFEIVYVTARTGAVCTITRGQEGTAAATWLASDLAYADSTAGILNNFALINGSATQNFSANVLSAVTGAFSGNLSVVGTVTSTLGAGAVIYDNSGGTSNLYFQVANTGGTMIAGVESSVGGTIYTNTTAYAAVIGASTGRPLQLASNGIVAQTIASSGATSFVGSVTAPNAVLTSTAAALSIGASSSYTVQGVKMFSGGGAGQFTDIGTNSASLQTIVGSALAIDVDNTTNVLFLDRTGQLAIAGTNASKASGTTWANLSDARIKKNVAPYAKGLDAIVALKPVTYKFNGKEGFADDGKTYVGYIAQDVEAVHPEMVTTRQGIEFTDLRGLDTSDIVPMLVNAVKQIATYMDTHP